MLCFKPLKLFDYTANVSWEYILRKSTVLKGTLLFFAFEISLNLVLPHILLDPLKTTQLCCLFPSFPPPLLSTKLYQPTNRGGGIYKQLNFGFSENSQRCYWLWKDSCKFLRLTPQHFKKTKTEIDEAFNDSMNKVPHDFISFQLQLKDILYSLSFVIKKKTTLKSNPFSLLKKMKVFVCAFLPICIGFPLQKCCVK